MSKRKIIGAVAALGLTVSLIGGTLAWFTSQDSVANIFGTGKVENPTGANGNGVEIYEDFTPPTNVLPGDTTTKLVQVQNTTSYKSFIRVKVTPKWTSAAEGVDFKKLSTDMIDLNFNPAVKDDLGTDDKNVWVDGKDGYYYFMGAVEGGFFTTALLDSVTLSQDANNDYRGAKYEVLVEAESIQATNDAVASWEVKGNNLIIKRLLNLQGGDVFKGEQIQTTTITSTNSRPE